MYTDEAAEKMLGTAYDELVAAMRILQSIMDSTEEEFLMLGSGTGNFSTRSTKIVTKASSVVDMVSGKNILEIMEQLNVLMGRISSYLKESEREIEKNVSILRDILSVVNSMLGPLGKLQGITKKLRALGISTMIQHAALRTASEGFRVLGDDIRNLSEVVNNHTRTITHEIHSLDTIIRTSISRLQALFESQRSKASEVLRQTTASIDSLNEKHRMSIRAAQDISGHYDNVTKSIRQIVTMLQFHDITRQQFEAVRDGFRLMTDKLRTDAMHKTGQSDGDVRTAAAVREVIHFCRVQKGKIRRVQDEFLSAIENVRRNLVWIASNVNSVIRKTGDLAVSRETTIESFLAYIESLLSTVSNTLSFLSENAMVRKELSGSISPVVDTAGEISAAMQEIQNIGREIQFISLNSTIKSSHVGREGRGLGVISSHIQKISSETQLITQSITEMLGGISQHVNELTKHLESHIFTREDEVQGMSDELKQLVRSLHGTNASVGSSLHDIDNAGMVLSQEITAVVDGIRSGASVQAACTAILDHLESLQPRLEQYMRDTGLLLYEADHAADRPFETEELAMRPLAEFGGNVELF